MNVVETTLGETMRVYTWARNEYKRALKAHNSYVKSVNAGKRAHNATNYAKLQRDLTNARNKVQSYAADISRQTR